MRYFINTPLAKRKEEYNAFYSYVEIVRIIGNKCYKILDAACGRGEVAQTLSFKGYKVYACDILDYFGADKSIIDFRLVNLDERLPHDNNTFDTVINCASLQYLNYPDKLITEAARILKNNGNLILVIPNIHSLQARYIFLKSGELTFYDFRDPDSGTIASISIIYLPLLLQLLREYRFEITDIRANVLSHSLKLHIFDALFGNLIYDIEDRKNKLIRFAHSLIITAKLEK
jgi:SAM-dependent methyltransferase